MLIPIFLLTGVLLGSTPAQAQQVVFPPAPEYALLVSFDIPRSRLMGQASLPVTAGRPLVFTTGLLQIISVQVNGERTAFRSDAGTLTVRPADTGLLTINYDGVFPPQEATPPAESSPPQNGITAEGIRLTGIWYPQVAQLARYRLTARLPDGYEAVSEGERTERHPQGAGTDFVFASSHPADRITLVASNRYIVLREQVHSLELVGYFFREHQQLGRDCLAMAKNTIARYERRLTLFPHRRLSIVEIAHPRGDSGPRRITLGANQMQSLSSADSALRRAIVRQWFGHLVYSPPLQGDWSQGLVAYLADHYGPERDRPDWESRRAYLNDLSATGDHGTDVPLHDLQKSAGTAAATLLRAKGAMVFHMLARLLGEERFFLSLRDLTVWRAYKRASWDDLHRVFERTAGQDLAGFFDQWVNGSGVPDLEISNGAVQWEGERFGVRFDVAQRGRVFSLRLPVTVGALDGTDETSRVSVNRETQQVAVSVAREPVSVIVDPDYDLARRLTDAERPAFRQETERSDPPERTQRGIKLVLRERDMHAVDLSGLQSLSEVIAAAAGKRIIYVGEQHDQFAHHRVQLQVAEGLYRRNPRLAIGMEMFQRPSQQALDDYIAGLTEEREFLKASEYFDRWGMNYNLYKPILDFARMRKLPVVALNTPREITRKVGRGGLEALTDEEKQLIPQELDFSDNEYRERLKAVFGRHQQGGGNFEYFHQAQILWDETMAEGVDRFLRSNPDYQMLVIVGGGHLAFGSGIPKRVLRRNGYDYAVILNDTDVQEGVADYIVYPAPMKTVSAPKLMVMLEEKGDAVRITGFPETSVSREAGLRTGDLLTALDDALVTSVADIKIALFYKNPEETVRVRVKRKRLLGTFRVLEFDVKLR